MDNFERFVRALNTISSQVYAFFALLVGLLCILSHQNAQNVGGEIIVGAFAIMRSGSHTEEGK